MTIQKAQGFVLKTQTFRSSSLIVTFFTREFGKMKGIVKGVRKERELRSALFELFSNLEIVFYEKTRSELHLISDAAMVKTHDALRKNLEGVLYAYYYVDLIDQVCELHDAHEGIYNLLDFTFRFLPSVPVGKLTRIFEASVLRETGWTPHWDACLECGNTEFKEGFFSVREGSVLCGKCVGPQHGARKLSESSLDTLRFFDTHSLEDSLKRPLEESSNREISSLIADFIRYRVGHELKTLQFIHKILNTPK